MARINNRLNVVIPVDFAQGSGWVHCVPVSRDVFEQYFDVFARALTDTYASGAQLMSARIAYLQLRRTAQRMGVWDTEGGVEKGLLPEIRRLTNIIIPGQPAMMMGKALRDGVINEEDVDELMGPVIFFTLAYWVNRKQDLPEILQVVGRVWGLQTTSLNCTEYADSLPTSTEEETSEPVETRSSVAY